MTPAQAATLARIDARLAEIEAVDYDTCPQALKDEHAALCNQRFEIVPPFGAALVRKLITGRA